MKVARLLSPTSLLYFLLAAYPGSCLAVTVNVTDCLQNSWNTAIVTTAAAGDTIVGPTNGSATWSSSTITVTKNIQKIDFKGCVITLSNTDALQITYIGNFANPEITGGTFQGTNSFGVFQILGSTSTLRIHHITFTNISVRSIVIATADPGANNAIYGLIDHILYSNTNHTPFGLQYGTNSAAWSALDNYGTNQAMYVEDNTISWNTATQPNSNDDVWDQEGGARAVIRHNTITNGVVEGHDSGSTPQNRALRIKEVYSNTFQCTYSGFDCGFAPVDFRGGSSIFFDNAFPICTSCTANPKGWENANQTEIYRVDTIGGSPWTSLVGGTNQNICNDFRSHCDTAPFTKCGEFATDGQACTVEQGSGICRDHPIDDAHVPAGTALIGPFHSNNIDGGGAGGYPARDQVGRGLDSADHVTQALTPAYWWSNTDPNNGNAVLTALNVVPSNLPYIKKNRDVFLTDNVSCAAGGASCTRGVGRGTVSQKPPNCSNADFPGSFPGPAYYATDTTTLYRCTAANTWTAYYTPFTYPHPLQGAGGTPGASLSPTTIAFGVDVISVPSGSQTVTLTNTGTASLTVTGINFVGTNAVDFSETDNCPGSLGAGLSCTITVTYTPSLFGYENANLSVSDNASGAPQTAALSGFGANPSQSGVGRWTGRKFGGI